MNPASMRTRPALELLARRPQDAIASAPFQEWRLPNGNVCAHFHQDRDGYLVRFPGFADFAISPDGMRVRCWPAPEATQGTIEHLFLNQVVPLARSRTGELVFHASAVEAHGGCLAFLGRSGQGKSTLAASFARGGHRFLSDDGIVVRTETGRPIIEPSHGSLRLWDDSQRALALECTPAAAPVQFTPKVRLLASETLPHCSSPRELLAVYVLGNATAVGVERLASAEALIELTRNSFLLDIAERQALATHFEELAKLVKLPMFYRLSYPRDYAQLPATRAAILDHAASLSRSEFRGDGVRAARPAGDQSS